MQKEMISLIKEVSGIAIRHSNLSQLKSFFTSRLTNHTPLSSSGSSSSIGHNTFISRIFWFNQYRLERFFWNPGVKIRVGQIIVICTGVVITLSRILNSSRRWRHWRCWRWWCYHRGRRRWAWWSSYLSKKNCSTFMLMSKFCFGFFVISEHHSVR